MTAGKYLNSFILTPATPRQTEDELLSTFVTHTQNISAWTLGHHGLVKIGFCFGFMNNSN